MPRKEVLINIAEDFSAYPVGRDNEDGPFNGERFRKDLLYPAAQRAISDDLPLVISLEGVRSFGSSFLEEAFGGLVRDGVDPYAVLERLELHHSMVGGDRYTDAIIRYMRKAAKRA